MKPETPKQWAAHRVKLDCEIGIKTIDGTHKPPAGVTIQEYAIYCLLQAVKSLAEIHITENKP